MISIVKPGTYKLASCSSRSTSLHMSHPCLFHHLFMYAGFISCCLLHVLIFSPYMLDLSSICFSFPVHTCCFHLLYGFGSQSIHAVLCIHSCLLYGFDSKIMNATTDSCKYFYVLAVWIPIAYMPPSIHANTDLFYLFELLLHICYHCFL